MKYIISYFDAPDDNMDSVLRVFDSNYKINSKDEEVSNLDKTDYINLQMIL